MRNAHQISLTNKQTEKLAILLDLVYSRCSRSDSVPAPMLLLLGGVRRSVIDEEGLDQSQIEVCLWAMDLVFSAMTEDEVDPQLEQLYHKLAGWWPVEPPWHVRIKDFNPNGEKKP